MLDTAVANLTSVPVLAFALGLFAALVKSELRLPEPLYQGITIYLLLGIGIKGGVALSQTSWSEVILPASGTLMLSIAIPILAFAVLGWLKGFSRAERGAFAAHYGSTSLVTFTAALVMFETSGLEIEGFLVSLLALMEIPGIIIGLLLGGALKVGSSSLQESIREVITGRSILLLSGGLLIGFLSSENGYSKVQPFFGELFTGVLALFLLELGIVAGRRLTDFKANSLKIILFAIAFPVFSGSLGVLTGQLTGLSLGGSALLGVISSSASYIAAPAAVRLALPEASPSKYLTASLGFTFPFNLVVGIPIMLNLSHLIESAGL